MKVTLNIEDSKAAFLMELLRSLDYVTIDSENQEVPEWHKQIVLDRIKSSKPEDYVPWNEAKKNLKMK